MVNTEEDIFDDFVGKLMLNGVTIEDIQDVLNNNRVEDVARNIKSKGPDNLEYVRACTRMIRRRFERRPSAAMLRLAARHFKISERELIGRIVRAYKRDGIRVTWSSLARLLCISVSSLNKQRNAEPDTFIAAYLAIER